MPLGSSSEHHCLSAVIFCLSVSTGRSGMNGVSYDFHAIRVEMPTDGISAIGRGDHDVSFVF